MSIVLDSNFLVALFAERSARHVAAMDWYVDSGEDLVTTPLALNEMDYLVTKYGGEPAARLLWDDFDNGAFGLRWWAEGLHETIRIARQHPFLGLTDASLVALAGILRTNRIATFDQHFRSVTTPDGEPFVVLPADR
ncbi:MAG TPA: PIN domain-containing protein [Baekduia sp.]